MINKRLFEWYKIDTKKNLQFDTYCPRPFDTVLIDKNGSCYICECQAWLPQSVGNIQVQTLEKIITSNTSKILQESIADGSYRYCNNKQCTFLLKERDLGWPSSVPKAKIKNIRLAIDESCNLFCPSCRNKQIFYKNGPELKKRIAIADKIIDYVENNTDQINIHIGSDGDPFASLVYRYFIKNTKHLKHLKFSVQTNGLLVKKMHKKNKELFDRLTVLNVSIDGATKNTYESLRLGGNFEKILENFDFIRQIKSDFVFNLHMVVQNDNWKEMPDMLRLADEYNADRVYFNKIQNWNTALEYSKQNFTADSDFKKLYSVIAENPKSRLWALSTD